MHRAIDPREMRNRRPLAIRFGFILRRHSGLAVLQAIERDVNLLLNVLL